MELNAYQPCPCHAEQKIKFCCGKQIVEDLNQVMALARGNQSRATLDKLDRLIAERGEKDCLLTLKTHYLIVLGDIDQARECNDRFLKANPQHPIGMQHRALIHLAQDKLPEAIDALQDAMDGVKGSVVPVSLGNPFRLVGLELLRQGNPIAARRHLSFARTLNPDDEQAAQLVIESYRLPVRTQLLKQDLDVPEPLAGQPWTKTYEQIRRRTARGQWRTARQYIEQKLLPQFPNEPTLLKAVAVLDLWLGRIDQAAEAWEKYSTAPGVSDDTAIDATMWVQLLRDGDSSRWFDVRQHSVPVDGVDALLERISESDRFAPIDTAPFETDEGPPPKAAFVFLDQPALRSGAEIVPERIPSVMTEMLVFGRQTDRPARIEFDVVLDGSEPPWQAELASLLGGSVDWKSESSELVGRISERELRLTSHWHLPSGIDRGQLAELERFGNERAILDIWPRIAAKALDDRTPLEVANDPKYRHKLAALVGQFELADQLRGYDEALIGRLREKLGLAQPSPIDPREISAGTLTPLQRLRVQWELVTDDVLITQLYYSMTAGHWQVLRAIGNEILRRPNLETRIPLENVCSVLANVSKEDEESLNYMRQARKIAHAKGEPLGMWLVAELELRLKRNIMDKTEELFEEIRLRHLSEPNVEMRLRRLMSMFGFGDPTDQGSSPQADADSGEAAAEPSALWTPQSAPGAGAGAGSTGKIWVPDLD